MTRTCQLTFVKICQTFVCQKIVTPIQWLKFGFSKNEIMTNFLSLSDNLGYTFKKIMVGELLGMKPKFTTSKSKILY